MLAKNPEEKSWNALLYSHLLLKKLLENKMSKEMTKFSLVEKAFIRIKF
jgi:hypothetical protein